MIIVEVNLQPKSDRIKIWLKPIDLAPIYIAIIPKRLKIGKRSNWKYKVEDQNVFSFVT